MRKFLVTHLIKDYENVTDPIVREQYGKLAGAVGIVSNALLCTIKIAVGLLFHSIAIMADGINNLSDAASSLITLIGFRLAAKPADEDHPYGHARIEYITGLIVSMLIMVLGFQLLTASIHKIQNPDPLDFSYISVGVLLLSIFIKIWQSLFNVKMGQIINSSTLKATGADSRNDVIATSSVLLGLIIGKLSGVQLDGYMGVLVALFIVYSGFQLIRETADPLLGKAPDPAFVETIENSILSYDQVLGLHDLVVHNYGPGRIFATVHVEVDSGANLMESHDMIDNIERHINEKFHLQLVVHMDPVDTTDPITNQVKERLRIITDQMDDIVSTHDLRVVPGYTHHNLIFDVVVSKTCKKSDSELKTQLTDALCEYDPLYRTVITFDKNYL